MMCGTKTRIYNLVSVLEQTLFSGLTRGDLQSSFVVSQMFDDDRRGDGEDRGEDGVKTTVYLCYFFLCVFIRVIIATLCVYTCV